MPWALAVALLVGILAAGCRSADEPTGRRGDVSAPSPSAGSAPSTSGNDRDRIVGAQWEAQAGDAWEEFAEGYWEGWQTGCEIAFSGAPDSALHDGGTAVTLGDCFALASDPSPVDAPKSVPDDPYAEGEAAGTTAGCLAAFEDLSSSGVLTSGSRRFDASTCRPHPAVDPVFLLEIRGATDCEQLGGFRWIVRHDPVEDDLGPVTAEQTEEAVRLYAQEIDKREAQLGCS